MQRQEEEAGGWKLGWKSSKDGKAGSKDGKETRVRLSAVDLKGNNLIICIQRTIRCLSFCDCERLLHSSLFSNYCTFQVMMMMSQDLDDDGDAKRRL